MTLPFLSRVANATYDGFSTPVWSQTDYVYDPFGNVKEVHQLGDTGTEADNRYDYIEYAPNTTAWIVSLPSRLYTLKSDRVTKISERWNYYDGAADHTTPPTKGDLTRVCRWLSGGTNPCTTTGYDPFGNPIRTTDANGNAATVAYDSVYQTFPVTETNPLNQSVRKGYDSLGRLISVTDPNNVVTTYQYDPLGRRMAEIVPPDTLAAPTVSYVYLRDGIAPEGSLVKKRKSVGGGTLDAYTFVDGFGRTIQTKSEAPDGVNQIVVDTAYNSRDLVESVSVPYLLPATVDYATPNLSVAVTWNLYDPLQRFIYATHPDGTRTTRFYDRRRTTLIDQNGHQNIEERDAFGRLIKVEEYRGTYPSYSSGDPPSLYATTTYGYDLLGNLIQTTDAQGNVATMTYDTLGRKIAMHDPDMGNWSYQYDPVGNLIRQTDAKGQVVTFTFDKLNRIKVKRTPDGKEVIQSYDDPTAGRYRKGRLWQVTDPSGATEFTYDARGRQTLVAKRVASGTALAGITLNPGFESGTTWPSYWTKGQQSGSIATFTWDATIKRSGAKSVSVANPTGWTEIKGYRIPYDPDKTYTASAWIKTQSLSTAAARVRLRFEGAAGNYLGVIPSSAVGGTTDWTKRTASIAKGAAPAGTAFVSAEMSVFAATGTAWFDDARLEDGSLSGTTYNTRYSYDSLNRMTSLTYPDGSIVNYAYSGPAIDRIYQGTVTYARYSGYNAMGQPGRITFGNGVVTDYSYFQTGNPNCPETKFRLCTITTGLGSATYQALLYRYDAVGNIVEIKDSVASSNNVWFNYDHRDRLFIASWPDRGILYSYDKIGNMTCNYQISACDDINGNYLYPPSGPASVRPHAVIQAGPNGYTYDANGNMLSGAGRTISYDFDNRPIRMVAGGATTTFVYDGRGERVKKSINGVATVYVGKLYECVGTACSKHLFAGAQRIALKPVGSTEVYYYHADHLGSSRMVTNQAGAKVQELSYYPYGETRTNSGGVNVRYKFTGQELDDSTSLYFYNARYYDHALSRFITPDTIGIVNADPQSLNRYSYVLNNPLRFNDPTGHCPSQTLIGGSLMTASSGNCFLNSGMTGQMQLSGSRQEAPFGVPIDSSAYIETGVSVWGGERRNFNFRLAGGQFVFLYRRRR